MASADRENCTSTSERAGRLGRGHSICRLAALFTICAAVVQVRYRRVQPDGGFPSLPAMTPQVARIGRSDGPQDHSPPSPHLPPPDAIQRRRTATKVPSQLPDAAERGSRDLSPPGMHSGSETGCASRPLSRHANPASANDKDNAYNRCS
ncbi:hypothetical protein CC86DRAFT_453067 [Ophiobolus disseminans]|uniref:Uncharacterized protein n=1 Tax=Ophiobolus disseminans TaxID=1469910 RepID=A0A6A7AC34_9PLEO|nr:hypothetical protein CC86DRAFT_453067 [Ophiobolus disseminans]